MEAPLPPNEAARLRELGSYEVLDTVPEQAFDDFVRLAAGTCSMPIAVIAFVDAKRQWFKAKTGWEISEVPRDSAICAVLSPDAPVIIPDVREDARFASEPLVIDEPHIRFYAGFPLATSEQRVLGALCVLDREPRNLTITQHGWLQTIARQVVRELESRRVRLRLAAERAVAVRAARLNQWFFSTMNAEVRHSIHELLGQSRLLSGSALNSEQLSWAHSIERSAEAVFGLSDEMIDYVRIEAKTLPLASVPYDPRKTLLELIAKMGSMARAKGLTIETRIQPDVPFQCVGDPDRLRQIFAMLLSNAIRFTERGSVTLELQRVSIDGVFFLRGSVSDTGIGVAPAEQAALFEGSSLVSLDRAREDRSRRKGVDLVVGSALVAFMGGTMAFTSEVRGGSCFSFTLPEENNQTDPGTHAECAKGSEARLGPGEGGPARVLVVEDNPINQNVVARLLRKMGCTVDIAGNGIEALSQVRAHEYALILMDYLMPKMNGIEATREIRRLPGARGQVPIIALTCSGAGDLRTQCLEAGMNEFIAKPLLPHTLRRLLETWTPSSQLLEAV